MKPAARLLFGSLALNFALLAAFAFRPALLPTATRDLLAYASRSNDAKNPPASHPRAEASGPKPNVGRQENFWRTLDSNDLPTLVRNLRAAGFSATVVRGIIVVRVNERIHAELEALAASIPDTPFWKSDPFDSATSGKFYEDANRLFTERWREVEALLGESDPVSSNSDVPAEQQRQDSFIPASKMELIRKIDSDYAEMEAQARKAAEAVTLPEDKEKKVAIERARRADIVALLTPEELAAYDLHYSSLTANLRAPLTFMNATEEEFRTIYAIHQPFAETLHPPGGTVPPELRQRHSEARQEIFAARLRAALGESRYADFVRASVTEFGHLVHLAERADIPLENAARAFDLRGSFADESNRIFDAGDRSADQKRNALQDLAKKIRGQLVEILGPTAGTQYAQSVSWIRPLESGSAIVLGPDGTLEPSRSLSPTNASGPTPAR
ncbi:MAG: hypothetical protein ABIZ81_07745 [Opitutaceae bacterium]